VPTKGLPENSVPTMQVASSRLPQALPAAPGAAPTIGGQGGFVEAGLPPPGDFHLPSRTTWDSRLAYTDSSMQRDPRILGLILQVMGRIHVYLESKDGMLEGHATSIAIKAGREATRTLDAMQATETNTEKSGRENVKRLHGMWVAKKSIGSSGGWDVKAWGGLWVADMPPAISRRSGTLDGRRHYTRNPSTMVQHMTWQITAGHHRMAKVSL
jgi:hypothetical protein